MLMNTPEKTPRDTGPKQTGPKPLTPDTPQLIRFYHVGLHRQLVSGFPRRVYPIAYLQALFVAQEEVIPMKLTDVTA
jgi:hypothetical protein